MPISESDFIALVKTQGTAETARRLGISDRKVRDRRARIEKRTGQKIVSGGAHCQPSVSHPPWLELSVPDGIVLVGSDAHFWPGHRSTAWAAFVHFAHSLSPSAIIFNGDALDGATISRHPPINWEDRPTLADELAVCKERLGEFGEMGVPLVWTLGNHDARFETRLATVASEYANVDGVHLRDHFPSWQPCYAACINGDVVVKHRWKGGAHATYNNTLHAGRSIVTGHLHSLDVRSFTDYNGTRYGVDCGTLAEPYGPQFLYAEDNARNWRSGFIVLTFLGGRLLRPEPVDVHAQGVVAWRGELVDVS